MSSIQESCIVKLVNGYFISREYSPQRRHKDERYIDESYKDDRYKDDYYKDHHRDHYHKRNR